MYQANAELPPLAPRVHFNQNQSVFNPFAVHTEIVKPQQKSIFSHDGRFNSSTDVFNENGRFAKFTETINRDKVDCMCIFPNNESYLNLKSTRMSCMDEISDLHCDYKYKTIIVTYKMDDGLENDTDDDKYQTLRLYRSKFLK